MSIHTCVYTHVYAHVSMHSLHPWLYSCLHAFLHARLHARLHACLHTCQDPCLHTRLHTRVHTQSWESIGQLPPSKVERRASIGAAMVHTHASHARGRTGRTVRCTYGHMHMRAWQLMSTHAYTHVYPHICGRQLMGTPPSSGQAAVQVRIVCTPYSRTCLPGIVYMYL